MSSSTLKVGSLVCKQNFHGQNTVTMVYEVKLQSDDAFALLDPIEVLDLARQLEPDRVPERGQQFRLRERPKHDDTFAWEFAVQPHEDNRNLWQITVTYQPPPSNIKRELANEAGEIPDPENDEDVGYLTAVYWDPVDRPAEWHIESESYQAIVTRDNQGKRLMNKAKQPYASDYEEERPVSVVVAQFNVKDHAAAVALQKKYEGKVNSTDWTNWFGDPIDEGVVPADNALCRYLRGKRVTEGNKEYYRMTARIAIHPEIYPAGGSASIPGSWQPKFEEYGYQARVPGETEPNPSYPGGGNDRAKYTPIEGELRLLDDQGGFASAANEDNILDTEHPTRLSADFNDIFDPKKPAEPAPDPPPEP